jgi:hypothetical protein
MVAKWMALVVFPVPPFREIKEIILVIGLMILNKNTYPMDYFQMLFNLAKKEYATTI